jgi:hypothetical protein
MLFSLAAYARSSMFVLVGGMASTCFSSGVQCVTGELACRVSGTAMGTKPIVRLKRSCGCEMACILDGLLLAEMMKTQRQAEVSYAEEGKR